MRARSLALGAALAAVVVAGCGSSSTKKTSQPTTVSAAVMAHAASKAASQAGYAFKVKANISATQIGGTADATGTAALQAKSTTGTFDLKVTLPGSFAALGALSTKVIVANGNLYVQIPSSLANVVPNVKPWLSSSLTSLSSLTGTTIPGLSTSSPSTVFKILATNSTGKAQDFGAETIAGKKTTHYREQVSTGPSSSPVTVDMWIDSSGLPAQIRAAFKSGQDSVRATLTFTSFAAQPAPAPPKQSGSLSSLIGQAVKSGL